MSTWTDLSDEAARWSQDGRMADLWWRDDDAADVGPALERLLAIHRDTGWVRAAPLNVRRNASSCPSSLFFKRSGFNSLCPFGAAGARL